MVYSYYIVVKMSSSDCTCFVILESLLRGSTDFKVDDLFSCSKARCLLNSSNDNHFLYCCIIAGSEGSEGHDELFNPDRLCMYNGDGCLGAITGPMDFICENCYEETIANSNEGFYLDMLMKVDEMIDTLDVAKNLAGLCEDKSSLYKMVALVFSKRNPNRFSSATDVCSHFKDLDISALKERCSVYQDTNRYIYHSRRNQYDLEFNHVERAAMKQAIDGTVVESECDGTDPKACYHFSG